MGIPGSSVSAQTSLPGLELLRVRARQGPEERDQVALLGIREAEGVLSENSIAVS